MEKEMGGRKISIFIFAMLMLIIFFTSPRITLAENWQYYGTSDYGEYYYDKEMIISPKDSVFRVWEKLLYSEKGRKIFKEWWYKEIYCKLIDSALNLNKKEKEGDKEESKKKIELDSGPKYGLRLFEFDCKNGTQRTIFYADYRDDGKEWFDLGLRDNLIDLPGRPALSGTISQALWKITCQGDKIF